MKKLFITLLLVFLYIGTAYPQAAGKISTAENDLFLEGESFYYIQNYTLAYETYSDFVKLYPFSPILADVQYKRALCLFYSGKYDESFVLLEKIENRFSGTRYLEYIPFWKGMINFYEKNYDEAIKNFDTHLASAYDREQKAQTYYYKAVCLTEKKLYVEAENTVNQFLTDYPSSSLHDYGIILVAYIYFKTDNPVKIISLFDSPQYEKLSAAMSSTFRLYYANALVQTKRMTDAKKIYMALIDEYDGKLTPASTASVALAKLFNLAQNEGDIKEMERQVLLAENTFADEYSIIVEFWTNIGITSYLQKKTDLAEFYLNKAWTYRHRIDIDRTVPLYLARIMVDRGNISHAFMILDEFMSMVNDQSEEVLFQAGYLSSKAGNWEKAVFYLSRFYEKYPSSEKIPDAIYLLSFAYYKTGETEKSVKLISTLNSNANLGKNDYLSGSIIKLYSKLLLDKNETEQAENILRKYLVNHQQDLEAQRDYLFIMFTQKKYGALLYAANSARVSNPQLSVLYPQFDSIISYFEGLAQISTKEYSKALDSFSKLTDENLKKQNLESIAPLVSYYRAWSLYRLGRNKEAVRAADLILSKYKENPVYAKALWLAGWCAYTLGDFETSAGYFQLLAKAKPDDLDEAQAGFFLAKSLMAQKKTDQALESFSSIFEKTPESEFADDALFEYAGILSIEGKPESAASVFLRLYNTYPSSLLAEEALFKRSLLLYSNNFFAKAKEAFSFYKSKFPKGKLLDAAIWWNGLCSANLEDMKSAISEWTNLVSNYPDSPFRSEALIRLGKTYYDSENFSKAMEIYEILKNQYEKESASLNINEIISKLKYRIAGQEEKEAQLSVKIDKNWEVSTREGRLAMNELTAYYFSLNEKKYHEKAFNLAQRVVAIASDNLTASRAQYFIGEYYFRTNQYETAGKEFLKAAFMDSAATVFVAECIYRSAEMMQLAGDKESAKELVARLIKSYPLSEWTVKGKKLVEGNQ